MSKKVTKKTKQFFHCTNCCFLQWVHRQKNVLLTSVQCNLERKPPAMKLSFWYLIIVLESLGFVPLAIMQFSQLSQCLGVCGSYTDDLH